MWLWNLLSTQPINKETYKGNLFIGILIAIGIFWGIPTIIAIIYTKLKNKQKTKLETQSN